MSSGSLAAKGRRAGDSPWVERLGRLGLLAQGVLYAVVGILAIQVTLGGAGESPDRQGALQKIAEQPLGKGLLVLLAIGLAGYALWRLAQAILDRDDEGEGAKGLAKRAGWLAQAVWYGILCALAISRVAGSGGGGGDNEQKTTADVFGLPAGRYLVYVAGLGFLATAGLNGYRAVTGRFKKKLDQDGMNEAEEAAATGAGVLGHLARMVIFGLIGLFLLRAAWEHDPKQARGLDGALLELARQPYGGPLLGTVAAGLIAFAIYCFVQARYRRI